MIVFRTKKLQNHVTLELLKFSAASGIAIEHNISFDFFDRQKL
jgi:hypothetical protein